MVNPILATIIKKAMTEGFNNQKGGGQKEKEKYSLITIFGLILLMISLITIGDLIIKYEVVKKEDENKNDDEKLTNIKKYTFICFISLMVFYVAVLGVIYFFLQNTEKDDNVKELFCISFGLMFIFITSSYLIKVYKSKDRLYFYNYIGIPGMNSKTHNFSWMEFGVGLVTNIIFGFIDNLGLFYGMDSIDGLLNHKNDKEKQEQIEKIKNQSGGNIDEIARQFKDIYDNPSDLSPLVTAGYGNTFSDFLGAFIGNAVGDSVLTLANIEKTPIISEIIGIVIGCLFGILIPFSLKGGFNKKSNQVPSDDVPTGIPITSSLV